MKWLVKKKFQFENTMVKLELVSHSKISDVFDCDKITLLFHWCLITQTPLPYKLQVLKDYK